MSNSSSPSSRPDLEKEDSEKAEQAMHDHFRRILGQDSIVFDIGANRGQFATELLSIMNGPQIYSFEPVPAAFRELATLAKRHPQIRPFELGISPVSGTAVLHVTESDVGASFLAPLPNQPSKWLTPSHDITVTTTSLKDFILAEDIESISLLKCDAQGYDSEVLKSAEEFFRPDFIKAILVELNFRAFYSDQANVGDLISLITKKGYRLAWMYPHRSYDEWLWWADALFLPDPDKAQLK